MNINTTETLYDFDDDTFSDASDTLYNDDTFFKNTRATFQQEQCQQIKNYYLNKTRQILKKYKTEAVRLKTTTAYYEDFVGMYITFFSEFKKIIKKLKQSGDKFHLCDHEFKNDFITTILDEFNVSYIVLLFHELRKYHNDDRYNNFYKEYQEIKKILQYIVDEDINLEINNLKKRFSYLLNNYLNFSKTKHLLVYLKNHVIYNIEDKIQVAFEFYNIFINSRFKSLLQQPVSRFENVEEKKSFIMKPSVSLNFYSKYYYLNQVNMKLLNKY